MGKEIIVTYGYADNNKDMYMVTRATISFRAGYHHVKVDAKNKNTLLKINYWKYINEIQVLLLEFGSPVFAKGGK